MEQESTRFYVKAPLKQSKSYCQKYLKITDWHMNFTPNKDTDFWPLPQNKSTTKNFPMWITKTRKGSWLNASWSSVDFLYAIPLSRLILSRTFKTFKKLNTNFSSLLETTFWLQLRSALLWNLAKRPGLLNAKTIKFSSIKTMVRDSSKSRVPMNSKHSSQRPTQRSFSRHLLLNS